MSHYTSPVGQPSSKWDARTFMNRGEFSYDTAPLEVWDFTYLHLALAVYVPSAATIDAYFSGNSNFTLLVTYGAIDARVEII